MHESTGMNNHLPLYVTVKAHIVDNILKKLSPGRLIPTQAEISKETGTSLITVKRAIKELEKEGYLEPKAGKGTFVKHPPLIDRHVGVSSWTDSISGLGRIPNTAWIRVEKRIPPKKPRTPWA